MHSVSPQNHGKFPRLKQHDKTKRHQSCTPKTMRTSTTSRGARTAARVDRENYWKIKRNLPKSVAKTDGKQIPHQFHLKNELEDMTRHDITPKAIRLAQIRHLQKPLSVCERQARKRLCDCMEITRSQRMTNPTILTMAQYEGLMRPWEVHGNRGE